jgi:hypothetical protein
MTDRASNQTGKLVVITIIAIAILAALIGLWKRGLRPVSPHAREAATTRAT